MEKKPLVSIIIPCYNVEKYIEDTLLSVINQSYKNIEIIVINDGSTDKTLEILKRFSDNKNIKIIDKKNEGVSKARNIGIQEANGELITFLDGDDIYLKEKIEIQVNKLNDSKYNACYCGTMVTKTNSTDEIVKRNVYKKNNKILNDYIIQKAYITTNDWMIRKSLILENNIKFCEELSYGEDFNFFMKVITLTDVISTGSILTMYRINSNSSSFNKKVRQNNENNYISEFITWIKNGKNIIYSEKEIKNAIYYLNYFLLPQVFIRNLIAFEDEKLILSEFEIRVLKSFKFNFKNIKSSIKYNYLMYKLKKRKSI